MDEDKWAYMEDRLKDEKAEVKYKKPSMRMDRISAEREIEKTMECFSAKWSESLSLIGFLDRTSDGTAFAAASITLNNHYE